MGQLGDVINFDVQPTTSYTLSAISGYTQHFPAEYAIMTLQFERQFGQPVIYYQIDYDTNEILAYPTIISGRIGESFEMVPPVAKGYNLIRVQGSSRGRFTDKVHPIFAFYRKEAWQTVKNVNFYIELKRALQPFDEPDGQKQAINLPAKSVWRVFQQITKVDGTIWYNIGGAEWLTAKYTASHTHPMKPELTYAGMRFHSNPLALTGQIDFVAGRSVTTYDQPYGASIGKLADGEKVNITHILRDDQGLHWYQLDTGAVLLATYIKVN
ncbi:hypothetical protein LOSG293_240190 [Secundilactobacillus oryzae JCM 18671]|uniref:MucBP domain-containing protein n=2 Tax=Secundilactobacillus oryzae TaxID=1202668 RepID=A0A081BJT4_9LACO|nr:hypothetical protein LOSG293_240190 [Secundilactobacillus oryzae JCM 18671]